MTKLQVSRATVSRLSIYGQALAKLDSEGVETVSSKTLSEIVGSTAAMIRKDLSSFGGFGDPGMGYRVKVLRDAVSRILGTDRTWNTALVGVGKLGSALLAYPGFRVRGFRIVAAFDNDITKVGRKWEDVIIDDISHFAAAVQQRSIEIAVIAVPPEHAQEVTDIVVKSGISAILNFASGQVTVPPHVRVKNADLSSDLESLSYFLTHRDMKRPRNRSGRRGKAGRG
jgi:redox-sensing transcriptional repressor